MRPYTAVNMMDVGTFAGPRHQDLPPKLQRKISDLGGNWTQVEQWSNAEIIWLLPTVHCLHFPTLWSIKLVFCGVHLVEYFSQFL